MKIINFGSLNIDHVYSVTDFVKPGETIASHDYQQFTGGKGCNQSVALANAGANVMHAGRVGSDGIWLKDRLEKSGADVSLVMIDEKPTGHAIIQVTKGGENSIILHGGANKSINVSYILQVLEKAKVNDYMLTQNETSSVPEIISQSKAKGLFVAFNPAPMTPDVKDYPLNDVDLFIVNETEGESLTGETDPESIISKLIAQYPGSSVLITLGAKGAIYKNNDEHHTVPALKVNAVDTTGAGDTFIGFFLAEMSAGVNIRQALETACKASAICVQRQGATDAIPGRDEVLGWAYSESE